MEINQPTVQRMAKDCFHAQLIRVYRKFDTLEYKHLSKDFVVNELNARKKKEKRLDRINKIPLIGNTIYGAIPSDYTTSSAESKFILSLMNNLGVYYLDKKDVGKIWKKKDEFYEKYYREKYELAIKKRLQDDISKGLENKKNGAV